MATPWILSCFANGSFDGVLLMGPLYHLIALEDRAQCTCEAFRLLRDGGYLFGSFITRYAAIRDAAANSPEWAWKAHERVESYLANGAIFLLPGARFTDHYAAHPTEVVPFMEGIGLNTRALIGVQSLVALHDERINALTGEQFKRWVDLSYRFGHDPALHGAALHLLYVGRRQTLSMRHNRAL